MSFKNKRQSQIVGISQYAYFRTLNFFIFQIFTANILFFFKEHNFKCFFNCMKCSYTIKTAAACCIFKDFCGFC
jgi:hypothetical protein